MLKNHRQWQLLDPSEPAAIKDVLDILMKNREMDYRLLHGDLSDLKVHLDIRGLNQAASIVIKHLKAGNGIVLFGDYDCDGVTSLALMGHFFRDIGYGNYSLIVAQRTDGYGVPERIAQECSKAGLLLTLDCGTHDISAVTAARSRGMDVVVIDHHEVLPDRLSPANVLVNPKHPACPSTFKEFSAVGLTLLFLTVLRNKLPEQWERPSLGGKYLILAALGTIADLVPLVGANRILARHGLDRMNDNRSFGPVFKLLEYAGIVSRPISSTHISYYLSPRINAAGRMADATLALDFLLADRSQDLNRLGRELQRLNAQRQYQEERILKQIKDEFSNKLAYAHTVVVGNSAWPHGLVGILAARIQKELLYAPTIVFSINETSGIATGSARGIPGFDLYAALKPCEDLLIKWGGHKMAAGVTIAVENLEAFKNRFEEIAALYPPDLFVPKGKIDVQMHLDMVGEQLVRSLELLAPHGLGNPVPTFLARKVRLEVQRIFGREKKHLQVLVNNRISGVFWNGSDKQARFDTGNGNVGDIIFEVEWDHRRQEPALNIKEFGKIDVRID